MWHLSQISLRLASAIAVLALIPAWKSGSILNLTSQAQSSGSALTLDGSKALSAKSDAGTSARLSATYGRLPISFEVNQGQTDRSVQFLARGARYTLFLRPGEAVLSLTLTPSQFQQTRQRSCLAHTPSIIRSVSIGCSIQHGSPATHRGQRRG